MEFTARTNKFKLVIEIILLIIASFYLLLELYALLVVHYKNTIDKVLVLWIIITLILGVYILVIELFGKNYTIIFEEDRFFLKSLFVTYKDDYKHIHSIRLKTIVYNIHGGKGHVLAIKTRRYFVFYLNIDKLSSIEQKQLKKILIDKSGKIIF